MKILKSIVNYKGKRAIMFTPKRWRFTN